MIGYEWGNVCSIVIFSPGRNIYYIVKYPGEGLLCSNYSEGNSGGMFAIRKVYYTKPVVVVYWSVVNKFKKNNMYVICVVFLERNKWCPVNVENCL
jgi:hypothetical protein